MAYGEAKERAARDELDFSGLQLVVSRLHLNRGERIVLEEILLGEAYFSCFAPNPDAMAPSSPQHCSSESAMQLDIYVRLGQHFCSNPESPDERDLYINWLLRHVKLIGELVAGLSLPIDAQCAFSRSLLLAHRALAGLTFQMERCSDGTEEWANIYPAPHPALFEAHNLESRRPAKLEDDALMYQVMLTVQDVILRNSKLTKNLATSIFRSDVYNETERHVASFLDDLQASRSRFVEAARTVVPMTHTAIYKQMLKYVPTNTLFKTTLMNVFDRYTERYRLLLYMGVDEWKTVREQPYSVLVHLHRLSVDLSPMLSQLCAVQSELLQQTAVLFSEYKRYGCTLTGEMEALLGAEQAAVLELLLLFTKYSDHTQIEPFIPPVQVSIRSATPACLMPDAFFLLFEEQCTLPVVKKAVLRCRLEDASLTSDHIDRSKNRLKAAAVEELRNARVPLAALSELLAIYAERLALGAACGFHARLPVVSGVAVPLDLIKKHSAHLLTILHLHRQGDEQFRIDFAAYSALIDRELGVLRANHLGGPTDAFCTRPAVGVLIESIGYELHQSLIKRFNY